MSSRRPTSRSGWKWIAYILTGKWLGALDLSAMDRKLAKLTRAAGRAITPNWLVSRFTTLQKKLRRAEKSVAKAGQKVSQAVADSAVGEGAKKLARTGKVIENQASQFILTSLVELLGRLVPQPLQRLIKSVTNVCWRFFGAIFVFLGRWFKTRHYWHLMGGLPAFLLALPLAYCMVRMPFYGDDAKIQHYRAAAREALEAKDQPAAELYYRKLAQLNAINEQYEFMAAIEAYERGERERALMTLRKLAPLDGDDLGYVPAHLWLASWYLYDDRTDTQAVAYQYALKHLDCAKARDPHNDRQKELRGYYLAATGKPREAMNELSAIAEHELERHLALAHVYASSGDLDRSRAELLKLAHRIQAKHDNNEELSAYEFTLWAHAHRLLNDTQRSRALMEEALTKFAGNAKLEQTLYELVMEEVNTLETAHQSNAEEVALLRRANELKPAEVRPIILLSRLASAQGAAQSPAAAELKKLSESPTVHSQFNAVLGAAAAQQGDYTTAAVYLEHACQKSPEDGQSLNNLAWVYLQLGDDRLAPGLDLANRALQVAPDRPDYRETRGQLLLKLQRPQEAIADLEFALNRTGSAVDVDIHRALADAYDQLGQKDLADVHRKQVR